MQWLMLQQKKPDDYVISTGKQYSVRKFIELVCLELGFEIGWRNKGLKEVGYIKRIHNKKNNNLIIGKIIIRVSSKYYRPAEVDSLLGDSSKAKRKLKWTPKTSIKMLVKEMVREDLLKVKKELI